MTTFYLLKIKLLGSKPSIWRHFVVPAEITLYKLHCIIQIVMGWGNCHLHSFVVGKQEYQPSEIIDDSFGFDNILPEEEYTLKSLVSRNGAKFKYQYDFGDDWLHEIVVKDTDYTHPDWPYPICCLEGEQACPPEDCGGIYGFADFCEAMANPKHPEHEELKEWYGRKYDPEQFDLDAINKSLGVKKASVSPKKVTKKAVKKSAQKPTD